MAPKIIRKQPQNDNIVVEKNDPTDCIVIQMNPPIFPCRHRTY
jgi:hypothetical protein